MAAVAGAGALCGRDVAGARYLRGWGQEAPRWLAQ